MRRWLPFFHLTSTPYRHVAGGATFASEITVLASFDAILISSVSCGTRRPPRIKPAINTATTVETFEPSFRLVCCPCSCLSKSSQSRLFILKSPLGRRGLDFGKRAPGAFRSLNGICSKAGRIKIISGARRTVIAHWDTFARAGDLFPREHLKQHVPSERWLLFLCSPYDTSAEVRDEARG